MEDTKTPEVKNNTRIQKLNGVMRLALFQPFATLPTCYLDV